MGVIPDPPGRYLSRIRGDMAHRTAMLTFTCSSMSRPLQRMRCSADSQSQSERSRRSRPRAARAVSASMLAVLPQSTVRLRSSSFLRHNMAIVTPLVDAVLVPSYTHTNGLQSQHRIAVRYRSASFRPVGHIVAR